MSSPFLLYHKIDDPTPDVKIKGAFTSPKRFEKQIKYLRRRNVSFLTASEMISHHREHGRFPERSVCLTFDDGWKDNYTHAFPIMKKWGATATIFLIPTVLGETTDRVTADGEGPREHMSRTDVQEMSAAGIEFGSHTMGHKLLHQVSADEVKEEIFESKTYIEDLIQKDCKILAYPAGFFTDTAAAYAEEAGYAGAFSTVYGDDSGADLYRLNRTEILRRDRYPFAFARKLKSILAPD